MSFYYPYPQYFVPAMPPMPIYPATAVTAITTPIVHQKPGWNPLHGQDPRSAPPGVGNSVMGFSTGMYYTPVSGLSSFDDIKAFLTNLFGDLGLEVSVMGLGVGIGGAARSLPMPMPIPPPNPPNTNSCSNCRNGNANANANANNANSPTSGPQPRPNSPPKSILKPSGAVSFSSSPTKSKDVPPLSILTHANTHANADRHRD
ncbi:hypothetical protein NHQ30_005784 [Ciborinia camelliae]|nr:hypothetical protein NHQ30_005784 [Ciborinia camelliae]